MQWAWFGRPVGGCITVWLLARSERFSAKQIPCCQQNVRLQGQNVQDPPIWREMGTPVTVSVPANREVHGYITICDSVIQSGVFLSLAILYPIALALGEMSTLRISIFPSHRSSNNLVVMTVLDLGLESGVRVISVFGLVFPASGFFRGILVATMETAKTHNDTTRRKR